MFDFAQLSESLTSMARKAGDVVLSMLQSRLELILLEAQEEKRRLLALVILAVFLIFFSFLAILLLCFLVIFLFWSNAALATGILLGVFMAGALTCFLLIRSKLKGRPFQETIRQIQVDRDWLKGREIRA